MHMCRFVTFSGLASLLIGLAERIAMGGLGVRRLCRFARLPTFSLQSAKILPQTECRGTTVCSLDVRPRAMNYMHPQHNKYLISPPTTDTALRGWHRPCSRSVWNSRRVGARQVQSALSLLDVRPLLVSVCRFRYCGGAAVLIETGHASAAHSRRCHAHSGARTGSASSLPP